MSEPISMFQSMKENRQAVEKQFHEILRLVNDGIARTIKIGIQPTEIWLGPKDAEILRVELNWQDAEGRLRLAGNETISALISGSMEDTKLQGLTVRLMQKDGVRVGLTV